MLLDVLFSNVLHYDQSQSLAGTMVHIFGKTHIRVNQIAAPLKTLVIRMSRLMSSSFILFLMSAVFVISDICFFNQPATEWAVWMHLRGSKSQSEREEGVKG